MTEDGNLEALFSVLVATVASGRSVTTTRGPLRE